MAVQKSLCGCGELLANQIAVVTSPNKPFRSHESNAPGRLKDHSPSKETSQSDNSTSTEAE